MGKKTQFARAEVGPVVAVDAAGTFGDVVTALCKKIRDGFWGEIPAEQSVCRNRLDLKNHRHHHTRQIKGEI